MSTLSEQYVDLQFQRLSSLQKALIRRVYEDRATLWGALSTEEQRAVKSSDAFRIEQQMMELPGGKKKLTRAVVLTALGESIHRGWLSEGESNGNPDAR